jgi:DNA-binding CsgD family transcriptional regulator
MRYQENYPQIIDDLYAGTLDQVAWNRAMISIADLVRGTGTLLYGLNPTDATILRDEIHRFDAAAVAEYRKNWITKDIRLEPLFQLPAGEAVYESKILRNKQLRSSEIYNDYLLRVDSPSFLVSWLHKSPAKVAGLSIQGSLARGPFDQRDADKLQPVIPHLRRALEIKDRLDLAQINRQTINGCLDRSGLAVLILDEVGGIMEASNSATELMRADCGIRRNADGTLWLREPAGRELNRWISDGLPPARNCDGLLPVPRPLAKPLSVLVTRLPVMNAMWISGASPCWMLLLFDPDRSILASTELVARDLGLSLREAELAVLLVNGCDVTVVAQRLHISIHTARTHLKSIFSKTGIRSQAELARRIAGGPAAIRSYF